MTLARISGNRIRVYLVWYIDPFAGPQLQLHNRHVTSGLYLILNNSFYI